MTDLGELHEIIQIAMGWTDSHLHQFVVGDDCYGFPDPEFEYGMMPEDGIRISALLKKEKQYIAYDYDFGDGWEHKIVLEKILPFNLGETVPKCITGRRGCPPEDVGGVWGYQEFLEIYKDTTHSEYERMVEWAGEYFDPERFDPAEINEIFNEEEGLSGKNCKILKDENGCSHLECTICVRHCAEEKVSIIF